MCIKCETGKRVASLNGLCEKCWDNAFGHPSWKENQTHRVNQKTGILEKIV
jgi:hypothetical protein